MKYDTCRVENVDVFYRKAGNPERPAVLLLHGFPSSSHMYRDLIPMLAEEFYVVAPDYPGFGQTKSPERSEFEYSFENIARIIDLFTDHIGLSRYAMYVFDYGAPVGSVLPDGYTLDIAYVSIAGRDEIQNDLILDYRTNVALYPEFQRYLREHQPPLLAVWGKNDPSFIPAGAEAFRKDLPEAEIHFVDSGHFALESHANEIASLMIPFLKKHIQQ